MSFFQDQQNARRNTTLLVALYLLAVAAIIAGVYFCVALVFGLGVNSSMQSVHSLALPNQRSYINYPALWNVEHFAAVALVTLMILALGSFYKIWQLSRGGAAVAEALGGRQLPPNSNEPDERKILNIVEEVSIASGVPVPPVFLLSDEEGINAFAAGFSTKNAVIGVTKGAIKNLNRSELQGVIAHEFSHILNGDMRLNIRLLGLLNGILMISMVGYTLFRVGTSSSSRYNSRRRSDDNNNATLAIVVAGLLLYVLGYIGVFFAQLIQFAVSRQREYLADASAVQFTRDPTGIGRALSKIAGLAGGSRIGHQNAREMSHFFFADGLKKSFFNLFATHPPIEERIRRIDPRLLDSIAQNPLTAGYAKAEPLPGELALEMAPGEACAALTALNRMPTPPSAEKNSLAENVGRLSSAHLQYAHDLVNMLPEKLVSLARDPRGARAVVYGLLLSEEPRLKMKQLQFVNDKTDFLTLRDLAFSVDSISDLPPGARLPLLSLTMQALGAITPDEYRDFRNVTQSLIEMDGQCTLFEYALQRFLRRHLDALFEKRRKPGVAAVSRMEALEASIQLVAALAHLSQRDAGTAEAALRAGLKELNLACDKARLSKVQRSLQALDDALYAVEEASPEERERAFKACCAVIYADRTISLSEAELIRAISDGLECPLPPFMPT